MAKNYYLILGISADATREDIKSAFRRRALELHPDRSGLGSEPFQDLQEAYSVLSDPARRRRYDRQQRTRVQSRARGGPPAEPLTSPRQPAEPFGWAAPARGGQDFSLFESFQSYHPSWEEIQERLWGNFSGASRPKAERMESLTVEVLVDPFEAACGGVARVWIPARVVCSTCGGSGEVGRYECWQCNGQGAMITGQPVLVAYPPGTHDGYARSISLADHGIANFYLTVVFRVSQ